MDATVAGRRPRELDMGARSDLRRKVQQHGIHVAAVTFRIPPEHLFGRTPPTEHVRGLFKPLDLPSP